jgi:hypothetical protein
MTLNLCQRPFLQLTSEVAPAMAPVTKLVPTKEVPSPKLNVPPKLNEPPKFHRTLAPAPALIISN